MLNKQNHNLHYKEKGVFLLIRLHKNCENVEFSPCGTYFVSWTIIDGKLRIWNCRLKQSYLILHNCISKIANVTWVEECLIVAHEQQIFIYDTRTWNYRKYTSKKNIIMGIPTLTDLTFLIVTKKCIHWVTENKNNCELDNGFHLKIKKINLNINKVILSPDNYRILLTFESNSLERVTRSLALIAIKQNVLKPVGFINAPENFGYPDLIKCYSLKKGCLLAVYWTRKIFSFYHLFS